MANLTLDLFTLCDYATISQDQKLSVIGIFDNFFVANLPTAWSRMFLVAVIKGTANQQCTLSLKVIPPAKTEQEFPSKDFQITIGSNGKSNIITELVNFPLPLVGSYKVVLEEDGKTIGELEFSVTKTTATYDSKKVVN